MTMTMAKKEECEGGNIDVEGDSSTETEAEVLQQLVRLSKELCKLGNTVKSDICSAFGKTCIKNVQSKDMIGKGNNKISKEYLAESIISFANLTTELSQFVNHNSPMLDIGDQLAASKETAAIKQVVMSFEQKFLKYSSEIESNSKVTAQLLTYMQDLQDSMKQGYSQSIPTESPAGMLPNTASPKTNPIPVCEPYVEHKDNGISD